MILRSRPNFQSKIGPRDLTRDSKPESKLRFDPDIRLKTQVLNWNPTSTLIPIDPDSRLYTRLSNRDSILILIRDLTSELGPNPDTWLRCRPCLSKTWCGYLTQHPNLEPHLGLYTYTQYEIWLHIPTLDPRVGSQIKLESWVPNEELNP